MTLPISDNSTPHTRAAQTPFDQFKAALSTVLSVPKSSLPKLTKKSAKK